MDGCNKSACAVHFPVSIPATKEVKRIILYIQGPLQQNCRHIRGRYITGCHQTEYRTPLLRGSARDFVLRLRFETLKVGTLINATPCDGEFLQIVDGNAKTDVLNSREPGMFRGEAGQPQTFISETSYIRVLFHTDIFTDQTYFVFDSRAEQ